MDSSDTFDTTSWDTSDDIGSGDDTTLLTNRDATTDDTTDDDIDDTIDDTEELPKSKKKVNIIPEQRCCTIAIIIFSIFFLMDIILGISFIYTNGKFLPFFNRPEEASKITVIPLENSEFKETDTYTYYHFLEGNAEFVVFDELKHTKEEVLEALKENEEWTPVFMTGGDDDDDEGGVDEILGHVGYICRCKCIGRKKNYMYWTRSYRVAYRSSRKKAEEDLGCHNPTCYCNAI